MPFSQGEDIKSEYVRMGVPYAWYPLEEAGYGPWEVTVNSKTLTELAYDFIVGDPDRCAAIHWMSPIITVSHQYSLLNVYDSTLNWTCFIRTEW